MSRTFRTILITTVLGVLSLAVPVNAKQPLLPVTERFKAKEIEEVPSFQRHVIPLVSRMGCNGRACHGSFQGRGGFRLSLFGYDFKADHDAMLDKESPRIDLADPAASLVLAKPTDEFNHEGGKRYDRDGWEYRLLSNWINAGAPFDENQLDELVELVVTPSEIIFSGQGKTEQGPGQMIALVPFHRPLEKWLGFHKAIELKQGAAYQPLWCRILRSPFPKGF